MHQDIFFGNPQYLADGLLHALRASARAPTPRPCRRDNGQRHRRFHLRVRQMRNVVFGFDYLAALGELGIYIADVARYFAGFARCLLQLLLVLLGVVFTVRTVVPRYV